MKLSIIIVNYNVKHFIEQCLYSVRKAIKNIEAEVFVVDNNSVDGSCALISEKFPEVYLIRNTENKGFSKANNQAIVKAKGEYIVLLNPDTVVEEDTFIKTINFMDNRTEAGALGVRMIDGNGNFLPESKRSFPSPMVAFFKMFGFTSLFPRSKIFASYHLGHLDNNMIHEVEVLSGAFMLIRKKVLDKIGLLDEKFFMYGEDIDISYRIIKAGYKNYYFPETTIIHYKGESTKKSSINYVLVFYNAMLIFFRKHFTKNVWLFSAIIKLAIYFRASVSLLLQTISKIWLPVIDALCIYLCISFIIPYWELYKFGNQHAYPDMFLQFIVPVYIFIWLTCFYFVGGYETPFKINRIIKGIITGSVIILILYALFPENIRFSRALIFIGAACAIACLLIIRFMVDLLAIKKYRFAYNDKKNVVIVAENSEALQICSIIGNSPSKTNIEGFVSPKGNGKSGLFIGSIEQLREIVVINKINEIIFCAKNLSSQEIIKNMLQLSDMNIDFKIALPDSFSIIGSNSIHTTGDLYMIDINSIAKETNRNFKRFFDIVMSLLFIFISPLLLVVVKKPFQMYSNIFNVLFGKYTFVGYYRSNEINVELLPSLKPSIFNPAYPIYVYSKADIENLNIIYAKNYRILNDLSIILKNMISIDKKIQ